jgi:chromosome segregation ATPase
MIRFTFHVGMPLLLGSFLLATQAGADDQAASSATSRMRDVLRSTMQQLNDAQNQIATLQAAQAQSDQDKAALQAKVDAEAAQIKAISDKATADQSASEAKFARLSQNDQALVTEMVDTLTVQINLLNKQGTDDKTTLEKSIADMTSKNPNLAKALDQYGSDIQLWKTGYDQYVHYANQAEAARQQLAVQKAMLQRLVDDREAKNLQLYDTASEILTRYEKFSLGDALSAKEPFIGVTRVRLQELVQDYKDKLVDEKVKIGQPPSMVAQDPAANARHSSDQNTVTKP